MAARAGAVRRDLGAGRRGGDEKSTDNGGGALLDLEALVAEGDASLHRIGIEGEDGCGQQSDRGCAGGERAPTTLFRWLHKPLTVGQRDAQREC